MVVYHTSCVDILCISRLHLTSLQLSLSDLASQPPTPSPCQFQLLIPARFPSPSLLLNPLLHSSHEILDTRSPLPLTYPFAPQYRLLRNNPIRFRYSPHHFLSTLQPARFTERVTYLLHLVDPAVCFGWHVHKTVFGALTEAGRVDVEVGLEMGEDAAGRGGGVAEEREGGEPFREGCEAGF